MVDAPFFEPPPPPPVRNSPPRRPDWAGPPDNVLGSVVAIQAVLARTPDMAVAVAGVVAYPAGFEFTCQVRHRRGLEGTGLMYGGRPSDGLDPRQFRIGVLFSDGTKATNLGGVGPAPARDQPPQAVMVPMGGGGGGRSWRQRFWVWPLPTPGPLSFVCEWTSEGIELSTAEVDGDAVRAAAGQVEVLWPPDEDGPAPPATVHRQDGRF